MKIVIPGGTGQVGRILTRVLLSQGHDVVALSRGGHSPGRVVHWDGKTMGDWAREVEGRAWIGQLGFTFSEQRSLAHVDPLLPFEEPAGPLRTP